jgi:hypothetical protein
VRICFDIVIFVPAPFEKSSDLDTWVLSVNRKAGSALLPNCTIISSPLCPTIKPLIFTVPTATTVLNPSPTTYKGYTRNDLMWIKSESYLN